MDIYGYLLRKIFQKTSRIHLRIKGGGAFRSPPPQMLESGLSAPPHHHQIEEEVEVEKKKSKNYARSNISASKVAEIQGDKNWDKLGFILNLRPAEQMPPRENYCLVS